MKQLVLFLFSLLTFSACIDTDTDLHVEPSSQLEIDEHFFMQETYEVPLQEGLVTVVTFNGDTLAITDVPLSIQVPIGSVANTRSGSSSLQAFHHKYGDLPAFDQGSSIEYKQHILYFEDSFKADYDYNDVVLQLDVESKNGNSAKASVDICVRGLALGSSKNIGFGFTDLSGNDHLLTDNVRRDYFSDSKGFINTVKGKSFVQGIISEKNKSDKNRERYSIVYKSKNNKAMKYGGYIKYKTIATGNSGNTGHKWKNYSFYIVVDNNKKLYIASVMEGSEGSLPYGIITPKSSKNNSNGSNPHNDDVYYPYETMFIGDAFPKFENWVDKNGATVWNEEKAESNCFKIDSDDLWEW